MKSLVAVALVAACVLGLSSLLAQDVPGVATQPAMPMHPGMHRGMMGEGQPMTHEQMMQRRQQMMQERQQMMQQMKQDDQQLQQKMQAVNQATSVDQKVAAMQEVLNLLVQDRTQTHERIMEMHQRLADHMMDHMRWGGMMQAPPMQPQAK
jgi:glutamate-1-semialdehyde aminotransferase